MTTPPPTSRRRLYLAALAVPTLAVVALLVVGLVSLLSSSIEGKTFANADEAKAAFGENAVTSSTSWGTDKRDWITSTTSPIHSKPSAPIKFGKSCFWASSDSPEAHRFDPTGDTCDPKSIPAVKIPEAAQKAATDRTNRLQDAFQKQVNGVDSLQAPYAITRFTMDNWDNVAAPTDIIQLDKDTFLFYVPIRDVPVTEITADGYSSLRAAPACLTLTSGPNADNKVATTDSC